MKHILLIIDSFGIGGAERAVINLTNGFLQKNCTVDLISIDDNIQQKIPSKANLHILGFKKETFNYFKYSKKLHTLINTLEHKNYTFDLILVNLQKSTRLMKTFKHKNTFHIIRNTLSQSALKNKSGIRQYFKKRRIQSIYKNLNLITLSNGIMDDMLKTLNIRPKSIQTINNSINFDFINSKSQEIPQELNLYDNYIIHVGRLSDAKRHDLLINAFNQANVDAKLLLVGDGPNKEKIQKQIKKLHLEDQVILLGFKSNPYPYIKNAKLLVLSSDYEGMPNVIIEALSLHTPVVSTNCKSGPSEILMGELSQYLVETNNIEQLSQKILEVYNMPYVVTHEMTKQFNLSYIINKYLNLIK